MKKLFKSLILCLMIIPCAVFFVGCTKDKEPADNATTPPVNEVKVMLSDDGKTLYRFAPDNDETEYTVPDGVRTIGASAFEGCDGLTKVVLPNSLVRISDKAFYSCDNLTIVEINSDIYVGEESFLSCEKLSNIDTSKINGYGEGTFDGCVNLVNVTIAKEVTILPKRVFRSWGIGQSNLITVTFESNSNLTRIDDEAFKDNDKLTTIDIPESCVYIGSSAFAYTGLTNLVFGKEIVRIGNQAFYSCDNLISIEFATGRSPFNNLTFNSNDYEIFKNCKKLETVINYPIADLPDGCFENCYNLSSFTFGNDNGVSDPQIKSRAFANCYSLKEFTILFGEIGSEAFTNCYSLNKAIIKQSSGLFKDEIDETAFAACYSLFEIYNLRGVGLELTLGEGIAKYARDIYTSSGTPSKIKSVNNVVYYDNGTDFIALAPTNRNVTTIEFDGKTTEINTYSFYNCTKLVSVVLQEGITKIGKYAFFNCKLTSVDIPASAIEIGSYAFDYQYLNTVIINNSQISNTCSYYYSNGNILWGSNNVYVKSGLTTTNSTYLLENFTKQATSDKTGYDMYVRNAE